MKKPEPFTPVEIKIIRFTIAVGALGMIAGAGILFLILVLTHQLKFIS